MFSAEKISIFGNKAVIKQNKFGVWQFRMWISSEKKYVEKSLRTKKKKGCPKINLQIRADNKEAINFYNAVGYDEDEVISFSKRLIED